LKPNEEAKRTTSVDELHKSNPTSSEEEEKHNKKKHIQSFDDKNHQLRSNLFSSLSQSSNSTSPQHLNEKKKLKES
jgi:hypothetical protein